MSHSVADGLLCDIAQAYEASEWDACNCALRLALLRFPDDGRFIQWQGLVWHAQGAFAAACRALETAALLIPLSIGAQIAWADAHLAAGRRDDARTILRFLAARIDDVALPHLPRLASGLGRAGEYALALDVCREASLREPEDDEACFGMAFFMNRLGYPAECVLPLLRRALALEPERPVYRLSVGVACTRLGLCDEAYELLCSVDPQQVTCMSCLRVMTRLFEQFDDARRRDAALIRALQLPRRRTRTTSASSTASSRPDSAPGTR
ncbi:MAG: hypothetical protein C0483_05015 [Pirellula sp.]|nr:hypothetical protein [Pirellula sp.]